MLTIIEDKHYNEVELIELKTLKTFKIIARLN